MAFEFFLRSADIKIAKLVMDRKTYSRKGHSVNYIDHTKNSPFTLVVLQHCCNIKLVPERYKMSDKGLYCHL